MTLIPVLALVLVALIHALPALGLLGRNSLKRLYGDAEVTPSIALLLRHRAALFATLAILSVVAIFVDTWRVPVLVLASLSVASFVVLWLVSGERSKAINRVAYVDLALTPVILAGLATAVML